MPNIKLFANLRLIAGVKEIFISGATLGELLANLVVRLPALEDRLFENGQLRRHVIITNNGKHVTTMDAPLTEADEVAIFPPIAGGA